MLSYCGDQFTTSSVTFLQSLLEKIYIFEEKNWDKWKVYWVDEYFFALENQSHPVIKGIINNLHPILTKIDSRCIKFLISQLEARKNIKKQKNFLWAYVSLIKIAREKSLIKYTEDNFYLEEIKIPREKIEVYYKNIFLIFYSFLEIAI